MLGSECPRCGRTNPVGERDRCLYCGASATGAEADTAGSEIWYRGGTDPDDVVIGPADQLKAWARSWPGMLVLFALLFCAGLFGYWRMMAHYAPIFGGGVKAPRDAPSKPRWMAKRDAEAALARVADLIDARAEGNGALPAALSRDLAELGGDAALGTLRDTLAEGRVEYAVDPAPDGHGSMYTLTAHSAEHGDLVMVKRRWAPGE